MTTKQFLSFILIFLAYQVSAQERYRVTYDYQTEKVNYLKLDKNNNVVDTLESPKLKRNSLVELKLSNVIVSSNTTLLQNNLLTKNDCPNIASALYLDMF